MFFKGWWTALAPHAEGTETQDGLVYCRPPPQCETFGLHVEMPKWHILVQFVSANKPILMMTVELYILVIF